MTRVTGPKDGDGIRAKFNSNGIKFTQKTQDSKCAVLLSIKNNRYNIEEKWLKALTEGSISEFKDVEFVLADTLQKYNISGDNPELRDEALLQKAIDLRNEWWITHESIFLSLIYKEGTREYSELKKKLEGMNVKDRIAQINQLATDKKLNFHIRTWDKWLESCPEYVKEKEAIERQYILEKILADSLNKSVEEHLGRSEKDPSFSIENSLLKKEASKNFLKEESPGLFIVGAKQNFDFIAYAGDETDIFKTTNDFFLGKEYDKQMIWLSIDFKRYHKNQKDQKAEKKLSNSKQIESSSKSEIIQENEIKESIISWFPYKDLFIYDSFFKKGFVLIRPKHADTSVTVDKKSFSVNDREFLLFYQKKNGSFSSERPNEEYLSRAKELLSKLKKASKNQDSISFGANSIALFNKKRREEIFLPLILEDSWKKQKIGLYVCPWITKKKIDFEFLGFHQYVTAGCLFGSNLEGMDQHGAYFALIKHDIKFFQDQKIEHIKYNPEEKNFYEEMLFSELRKLANLIDFLAKSGQPKFLFYHLPYGDYILFGVELFVRGRISLKALDSLIKLIFEKKEEHIQKIKAICKVHEIIVTIESPFENLFGAFFEPGSRIREPATDKDISLTPFAKFILDVLQLSSEEVSPDISVDKQKEKEKALVQYCLLKLQINKFKEEHRQAWEDFASINAEQINSLEELFKIANAVMVAIASKGKNHYETCSLLSLAEKQIQVSYDTLRKKYATANPNSDFYPAVFNITTYEPFITYSPTTKGLPFYFGFPDKSLVKLITEKNILQYSYANVGHFSSKIAARESNIKEPQTKSIGLKEILPSQSQKNSL